jgi:hypothetical protein
MCQFGLGCLHTTIAIIEAVEQEKIAESRYRSYLKMRIAGLWVGTNILYRLYNPINRISKFQHLLTKAFSARIVWGASYRELL